MANKFFNRRMVGWYLLVLAVLIVFLWFTHLPVFPCMDFVSDSSQGFYVGICSLVNEEGILLFNSGELGYYDSVPFFGTWLMAAFLVILPYVVLGFFSRKSK